MSILKKLFGGGAPKEEVKPEEYKGFAISPEPIKDGGQYRVCAVIRKDGKEHRLIRADTMSDPEQAREASVGKAKQMIDEQGDGIFD